jgi:hypothetical protein
MTINQITACSNNTTNEPEEVYTDYDDINDFPFSDDEDDFPPLNRHLIDSSRAPLILQTISKTLQEISKLEKLEKSIPFNDPIDDPNNDLYFFTPVTEEILDPTSQLPKQITILTGKLEPHLIPPNTSEELRANLKTAKKTIDFIRNSVPFSGNFLQRSRIFSKDYYDPENVKTVQTATDLVQDEVRDDESYSSPTEYTNKILEYKTGNCFELSLAAIVLQDENAMLVQLIKGNHNFVIVGCTTNPSNNDTLNSDALIHDPCAVVCCPWTGSYYPASMLEKQLFSYIGQVKVSERLYTQVEAFDSSKDGFSIIYRP